MEFTCVLSVGGSLASYRVKKESKEKFTAVLREGTAKRTDIPPQLALEKSSGAWKADPWHDEIVRGLLHAIEANAGPAG